MLRWPKNEKLKSNEMSIAEKNKRTKERSEPS